MRDQPEPPSDRTEYPNEEPIDRRESPADPDDDSFFPFFVPYGWPVWTSDEDRDELYIDEYERTQPVAGEPGDGDGAWLDEGLITVVFVAGVALFLLPEPATSGLGVFLMLLGAAAWIIDWAL